MDSSKQGVEVSSAETSRRAPPPRSLPPPSSQQPFLHFLGSQLQPSVPAQSPGPNPQASTGGNPQAAAATTTTPQAAAGATTNPQSALLSASLSTGHSERDDEDPGGHPHAKPKRNPRQQEQNKQAQQRYRAKRKAQFEEMQGTVQVLMQQVQALQREKQEAQHLEGEILQLKAFLAEKEGALQTAASEVLRLRAAAVSVGGSSGLEDQATAQPALSLPLPGPSPLVVPELPPLPTAAAAAAAVVGAAGRSQPLPVPAQLGLGGVRGGAAGGAGAGAAGVAPAPAVLPTPGLIQHALQMYYQDLQHHAAATRLEHLHPTGRDANPDALGELQRLLQAGTELVKMVLQASGPGAQQLLLGSSAGPAGHAAQLPSPADNHQLWQQVGLRLQLSSEQVRDIGLWRDRYVQQLDEIYGRRLLLKAQVVQMGGSSSSSSSVAAGTSALLNGGREADASESGGEPPQWAESLLLQAVSSAGYSASAHAAVELDGLLDSLRDNVRQERDVAGEMMQTLLTQLLTPIQATRYLLAGHPFTWNGLAFAHALTGAPATHGMPAH
ncbi:hypothetical protein N2152v2_011093 [Parachlorella kessleri]